MFDLHNQYKKNLYLTATLLITVLSLYFAVKIFSEIKFHKNTSNVNSIVLSGHGEVQAIPNMAKISFVIRKEAKTVTNAQEQVAKIEAKVLDFLKKNNIPLKDIKTSNASFYPKYEYKYNQSVFPCAGYDCSPRKRVIVGYEASESIDVKLRNVDDIGKIMQGIGKLGVNQLNGPNFVVENKEFLEIKARKKAIEDAKEKALILAEDLDVRLGKIISFSESNNNFNPVLYARDTSFESSKKRPSTEIPKGENTISSNVFITYEIK